MLKFVAPRIGGVEASDGSFIEGDEKIDGGPSVVFDAVAILLSDEGAKLLSKESTARDFAADAFAHLKFIAHSPARSEEHTSELQSLMRISYAVFCLKKKKKTNHK